MTPEQRSYTMGRVRGKDTNPEMAVRRLVHGMGYRYGLHRTDLPGKPDIVLTARRKVIFVHGCFWHGHKCKAGRKVPKSNKDYWLPKLQRNKGRDSRSLRRLRQLGWSVLVVWECQLKRGEWLCGRISRFLAATSR